jgi:hypothetical protein
VSLHGGRAPRLRGRAPRLTAVAFLAAPLAGALGGGCDKTMADDDCQKVATHLREVWDVEAKKAAPTEGPAAAKASAVIQAEGDKVVGEFLGECKKDLAGRRVDAEEVACILAAQTIEAVTQCGKR